MVTDDVDVDGSLMLSSMVQLRGDGCGPGESDGVVEGFSAKRTVRFFLLVVFPGIPGGVADELLIL